MRTFFDRLLGRGKSTGPLTRKGLLASDLWIDQPGAAARIDAWEAAGEVDGTMAAGLRQLVDEGYTTFRLDASEELLDGVVTSIDEAWRQRPDTLAYAYHSGLKLFPLADETAERQPSYRIADLHGVSHSALGLYLNRQIFDWVERIFGRPAVATQSLTFEFGSQQELHRDPVHVHMSPPHHLVAAWIALEDIDPRCGPLTYVPGSHRLPYYRFPDGDYRLHQGRHGEAEVRAAAEFDRRQWQRKGLERRAFTPAKGEVLLWHHSLLHGGSRPEDPSLTRKSFVVHFTTLGDYPRLRQAVLVPGEDGGPPRQRTFGTDRILEHDGCHGFANPIGARAEAS